MVISVRIRTARFLVEAILIGPLAPAWRKYVDGTSVVNALSSLQRSTASRMAAKRLEACLLSGVDFDDSWGSRSRAKARRISIVTLAAVGLRRTAASIPAPCSVNAYGSLPRHDPCGPRVWARRSC